MRLNCRLQAEVFLLQVVEFDGERLDLVLDVLHLNGGLHHLLLLLRDALAHGIGELSGRAARGGGSLKKVRKLDN